MVEMLSSGDELCDLRKATSSGLRAAQRGKARAHLSELQGLSREWAPSAWWYCEWISSLSFSSYFPRASQHPSQTRELLPALPPLTWGSTAKCWDACTPVLLRSCALDAPWEALRASGCRGGTVHRLRLPFTPPDLGRCFAALCLSVPSA